MVVQSNRPNSILLGILRVTVHTIQLRLAACWHIFELWIVFVLLISIDLAIWYLVYTIMSFLLPFIVYLTFIHIIKVFLALSYCFLWSKIKF